MRRRYWKDAVVKFYNYATDEEAIRVTHLTTLNSQTFWIFPIIRIERYEGWPESIQPFLISRESIAWPWCNLAASKRRPYCVTVNSHSRVRLVSWQWDAIDWACVLCALRVHKSPPFHRRFYVWEKLEVAGSKIWDVGGWQNRVMWCFAKKRSLHESCIMGRRIVVMKLICSLGHCECNGHTVYKLSQRRLIADWLVPRESDVQ
jgi:hypothetical protein